MDLFCKRVTRRMWLNQILSWCIRGSIKNVKYSRGELIELIKQDEGALREIPEREFIFDMLQMDVAKVVIELFIRKALTEQP